MAECASGGMAVEHMLFPGIARRALDLGLHVSPDKPYRKILLAHICHAPKFPLDLFFDTAEAAVRDLCDPNSQVLTVEGSVKGTEAHVCSENGDLCIRMNSLESPEFWAKLRIPHEVVNQLRNQL